MTLNVVKPGVVEFILQLIGAEGIHPRDRAPDHCQSLREAALAPAEGGECESTSGSQDAVDFCKDVGQVGKQVKGAATIDDVELAFGEWDVHRIGLDKGDIAGGLFLDKPFPVDEHRPGQV
jgi:hypothetical protein